jgi:hypothetical protein
MDKPIHIRVDAKISAQLDEGVRLTGKPKADITRDALAIGLDALARIGYDLQAFAVSRMHDEGKSMPSAMTPLAAVSSSPIAKPSRFTRA